VKNKFTQTVFFAREHPMTLYCVSCRVGSFSFLWYHLHLVKIFFNLQIFLQKLQLAFFMAEFMVAWFKCTVRFLWPALLLCVHARIRAHHDTVIWPTFPQRRILCPNAK